MKPRTFVHIGVWCIVLSIVNLGVYLDYKDELKHEASKYTVTGTVEGFRTVKSGEKFLFLEIPPYHYEYVVVNGVQYRIDNKLKEMLRPGQVVHLQVANTGLTKVDFKE